MMTTLTCEQMIEAFVKTQGVSRSVKFGVPEIDALYPRLRARGHTIAKLAKGTHGRHWVLDDDENFRYGQDALIKKMRNIVKNEKPLEEYVR